MRSWIAAAVPTQVAQPASPSSRLAGAGYTPTLDARSFTNIGLLAIDDLGYLLNPPA
jgi:hypothetical protein